MTKLGLLSLSGALIGMAIVGLFFAAFPDLVSGILALGGGTIAWAELTP